MTRSIRTLFAAACGLMLAVAAAGAGEPPAAPGLRSDIVANMMDAGDKIVELAAAMPANKWGWRPGKGVRSVGEVYQHVAMGNFMLGAKLGAKPPLPMDELMGLGKTQLPAAKVVTLLEDSYAFATKAITEMPESEAAGSVELHGHTMSRAALMLVIASHSHEHLGQAIAYARVNGVVPPWTAREQAAAKAKQPAPAAGGAHGHNH